VPFFQEAGRGEVCLRLLPGAWIRTRKLPLSCRYPARETREMPVKCRWLKPIVPRMSSVTAKTLHADMRLTFAMEDMSRRRDA
jgi:hypothetical protein